GGRFVTGALCDIGASCSFWSLLLHFVPDLLSAAAQSGPERARKGAEDVGVELILAGALDQREDVVVCGGTARADGKGRKRKVEGEEFREHPFRPRAADADCRAPVRQVGDRADTVRQGGRKPRGQSFVIVDDEESARCEAERALAGDEDTTASAIGQTEAG